MALFPAHAGVILELLPNSGHTLTFPRTRGGDPIEILPIGETEMLFPAHAGVIPRRAQMGKDRITFPRTRGGDPDVLLLIFVLQIFSPHTRG